MTPIRILCLNYEYPPIGGGGGRACAQICQALVSRGHAVQVRTTGMAHLPSVETVNGVEIHRTRAFRKREDTCSVPEMAAYLAASFVPTIAHIRRWKPHVIHAHFAVPTGALAWAASVATGVPYVLTAHLGDVPGGVPEQTDRLFKLVGPLTRPIWSHAADITAVSGFVGDLAETAYQRKPVIIPNGIPLDPRPKIEPTTTTQLIMVGRLSIQKNPLLTVRALALLQDLPWECDIIGDGPLRPDVEREITSAGLASRIRMHGWLDSAEVHGQMRTADILLMPSLSEGMPVAAVEALNHGLAIVAGPIPGMRDVLTDGDNGLTLHLNPEAFAEGLRRLLADPALLLKMREASSAKALQFDITSTCAAYEKVLSNAVRGVE